MIMILNETELNTQKLSAILYKFIVLKLGVNIPLMPGKNSI